MRLSKLSYSIVAGLTGATAVAASAATISYSNTDFGIGGNWRSLPVVDNPAATNVLGQQGYDIVGNDNGNNTIPNNYGGTYKSEPSYITIVGLNSTYPGNANYAQVDNPLTTPGGSPTKVISGTTNPFPGTNVSAESFAFRVGAGASTTFQVAVLIDNLDSAGFNSNSIHVSQFQGPTNTGSIATVDTTGPAYNDRAPDLLYFTITGAQPDDTFYVGGTGGPNGAQTTGLIAFDTVTPEPASMGLLAIGGLGLLARRRRA